MTDRLRSGVTSEEAEETQHPSATRGLNSARDQTSARHSDGTRVCKLDYRAVSMSASQL